MDKKIGIITLHRVYNYGSVLQAYATQKIFQNYSNEVFIIDYRRRQDILKNRIFSSYSNNNRSISNMIRLNLYYCGRFFSIILKELTIGLFCKKKLNLTKKYNSFDQLLADPPHADLFVTGSDQTWNSIYNNGIDPAFFLQFAGSDVDKIAFCASIGKTSFDEYESSVTKKYLAGYKAISVREESAKALFESIGVTPVSCLIDPTLQFPAKSWYELASKKLVKDKYLLLLILYNEDNDATEIAKRIAKQKGLKVVQLAWRLRKPNGVDILMTHRSPEDFLSLIYYADFIVTNSFHGLCFSINFEKQFVAIRRNEFNTRIECLLNLFDLSNRIVSISDYKDIISNDINYLNISETLKLERKKAACFLRNAIGEETNAIN